MPDLVHDMMQQCATLFGAVPGRIQAHVELETIGAGTTSATRVGCSFLRRLSTNSYCRIPKGCTAKRRSDRRMGGSSTCWWIRMDQVLCGGQICGIASPSSPALPSPSKWEVIHAANRPLPSAPVRCLLLRHSNFLPPSTSNPFFIFFQSQCEA